MRHGVKREAKRNFKAVIRDNKGNPVWTCDHVHAFQDIALNCADQEMARRGWTDEERITPQGQGMVDRKPTLDEM